MTVWTCAIRCDVRGCMRQIGGSIKADNEGIALYYGKKEAVDGGWDIGQEDGTDIHLCPEHKRHE